jgi:flagellar biosynthesis/type III secretory pathway protein FliH
MAEKIGFESLFGPPGKTEKVGFKGILRGEAAAKATAYEGFQDFNLTRLTDDGRGEVDLIYRQLREFQAELDLAKTESKRLKEGAPALLEKARAEGMSAGLAQGEKNGRASAQQEVDKKIAVHQAKMESLLRGTADGRREIAAQMEEASVAIALALFRRVMPMLAEQDVGVARAAVQSAFAQLGNESKLRLRVAPSELAALKKEAPLLRPLESAVEEVELVGDARVAPGGCLMETEAGTVDARLEVAMAQLEESVKRAWAERKIASAPNGATEK